MFTAAPWARGVNRLPSYEPSPGLRRRRLKASTEVLQMLCQCLDIDAIEVHRYRLHDLRNVDYQAGAVFLVG